jgi:hypothetical protein
LLVASSITEGGPFGSVMMGLHLIPVAAQSRHLKFAAFAPSLKLGRLSPLPPPERDRCRVASGTHTWLAAGPLEDRASDAMRSRSMPLQRLPRGSAAVSPGGIASRSAATARVHLRDQHFEAAVGSGLTDAASVAVSSRAALKCRPSCGGQQNCAECSRK